MAAACTVALAGSVIIPRLASDPNGGLAAATTATVAFLGLALIAALEVVALLVYTLRRRRLLSRLACVVGRS